MSRLPTLALLGAALLCASASSLGCQKTSPPSSGSGEDPGPGPGPDPTSQPWEHPKTGAEGSSVDVPADLKGGLLPPPSRAVRRMRIDTLQASMTKVAGNDVYGKPIEWKYNGQNGFSDAAFGKALGRPDFQASTSEAGVSSALYLKLVGDAARDICMQMVKNDLLRQDASTRSLFPKAPVDGKATDAQIEDNLKYDVLRFLGVRLADKDPMIAPLRGVYDAGVASIASPNGGDIPPAAEGWRAVCIALFESPLFHND